VSVKERERERETETEREIKEFLFFQSKTGCIATEASSWVSSFSAVPPSVEITVELCLFVCPSVYLSD